MTSRLWYAAAIAAFLAGGAGAGMLVWAGLSGLDRGLTRIVVPGASVLTLSEPGSYTIFHEPESVIDGKLYASQTINGLRVGVIEEAGDAQIAVAAPAMTSRYSIGGRSGVSVLAFDVARPGRYRLTAAYDGGRTEPVAVLAVGQGFIGRLVMTILAAVGAALAGMIGALVIALITFFSRRKMQRAVASNF